MHFQPYHLFTRLMRPSILLFDDSESESSTPRSGELQKKISRKHRRIPVVTFIVLLIAVVLALIFLEHYI